MTTDSSQAPSIELATSPDEVWAVVGDFGAVGEFIQGLEGVDLEGDDRVIRMPGLSIRERLISRDTEARSYTYSVVDGVPLEHHEATIKVDAHGEGSKVTWSFKVAPESMVPIFQDTYEKGLQSILDHFS